MAKIIDVAAVETALGTSYPAPFDEPCRTRAKKRLGDAAGLTQFGVNLLRLPPGAWSSQRHWHSKTDELIYVLEGEVVLVNNAGEQTLRAGQAAGFKAGDPDGHSLRNQSDKDALILEMGTRAADDAAFYPDIDMMAPPHRKPAPFTRKDGTPFENIKRRGPGDT